MQQIERYTEHCRRMPKWAWGFFQRSDKTPSEGRIGITFLSMVGALVVLIVAVISIIDHFDPKDGSVPFSWPLSTVIGAAMILYLALTAALLGAREAVMFSAPRAQAPTWWMRNRASVVITVVCSAVFLWLGHIWH
jgi:hypothetical protein